MTNRNLPSLFDHSFFDDATFGPLIEHSLGLDRYLNRMFGDLLPELHQAPSHPPYNIRIDNEFERTLELAVAGYGENEIEVLVDEDTLVVKGNKVTKIDESDTRYAHKGIATRKFERKFVLGPGFEVEKATLKDGMLAVTISTPPLKTAEVKRIPVNAATADPTET